MVTIGVMVGLGLWLLGVPFAFALALIAGLLEFIPYVGPILSAVPALLVALAETPELALYVLMLYIGVQSIEGYVLQPLIQERAVYLPPAVLLLAQLVLGILVGALGVMLATPMTAAVFVMIRMLYVQDVLGEPAAEPKVPS
jgi:predicted PurR-regulated permease PerM